MKNFDKIFNRSLNIARIKIELAFLKLGDNDVENKKNLYPGRGIGRTGNEGEPRSSQSGTGNGTVRQ